MLLMHAAQPRKCSLRSCPPQPSHSHTGPRCQNVSFRTVTRGIKQKAIADSGGMPCSCWPALQIHHFLVQAHHMHSGEHAVWPASGLTSPSTPLAAQVAEILASPHTPYWPPPPSLQTTTNCCHTSAPWGSTAWWAVTVRMLSRPILVPV
jgi:hypothetical protein